jgi:poly(3-hydroxybutyrate) depolymerase
LARTIPRGSGAYLAALLSLSGCGVGFGSETSPRPGSASGPADDGGASASPAAAGASTEPPAPACVDGATRCTDDGTAELCQGGRFVPSACAASAACVSGACASLVDGALTLPREALLVPGKEGWLNAWRMSAPFEKSTATRLAAAPDDAWNGAVELGLRNGCFPEGFTRAFSAGDRGPTHRLFTTRLVNGRERRVRFAAGAEGRISLVLQRSLLLTTGSDEGEPLRDEVEATAVLPAGTTRLAVLVERTGARAGFWLRLRAEDGGPLADLALAPDVQPVCAPSELLALHERVRVAATGFDLDLELAWDGLAPRGFVAGSIDVGRDGSPPLVTKAVTASELLRGLPLAVLVPAPTTTRSQIFVRLGAGTPRKVVLFARPDENERATSLAERVKSLGPTLSEDSRASLEGHLARVLDELAEGQPDSSYMKALVDGLEKLVKQAETGADPYAATTGIVRRAYRSLETGALQPYLAFVPRSAKPGAKKKRPLVIALHGLDNPAEIALRTVFGEALGPDDDRGFASRHMPPLADYGILVAAPFTYGNAGPRPLGEADVLAVIDAMRRAYPVDEDRISITGYSMGGTGAFLLPLHYPDLFSAAAPLCGYPNLHTYRDVTSVPRAPFEDVLIKKRGSVFFAENGLHVPFSVVHGGQDDPARSAVLVERMREVGVPVRFDVQDDLGHDVWTYAYEDGEMLAWLAAKKRPRAPERVRLVASEPRYDRAYWVRLLAATEIGSGEPARIEARFVKAEQRIEVTTSRVRAFALELKSLELKGALTVVVDGQTLAVPDAPEIAYLERLEQGFVLSAKAPRLEGWKRGAVAGPLDDWFRHRALIVYGTQDPRSADANRLLAEHLASARHWKEAHFPVIADVDLRAEDRVGRSLVLVGSPRTNKVTAQFERAFPVKFEPDALSFRGARYEGADVGVAMIRPHPDDAGEYLVLYAGVGHRGVLAARNLPELLPDYLVFDDRMTERRGGRLLAGRAVLAGGFFGDAWE